MTVQECEKRLRDAVDRVMSIVRRFGLKCSTFTSSRGISIVSRMPTVYPEPPAEICFSYMLSREQFGYLEQGTIDAEIEYIVRETLLAFAAELLKKASEPKPAPMAVAPASLLSVAQMREMEEAARDIFRKLATKEFPPPDEESPQPIIVGG